LNNEDVKKIVMVEIKKLSKRLQGLKINITFDQSVIDFVAKVGFDEVYGARPLKRLIQKEIINQLSKRILGGDIDKSRPVMVDVFDGVVVFRNDK
jgi:ATP-dependent Clp protease ATP-binding subunit ClpB